jgi:hypothetical protein
MFLPDDSIINLWLIPVVIIMFSTLFFASYGIQTSSTITTAQNMTLLSSNTSRTVYEYTINNEYFKETAFSWMFLGIAMLNVLFFLAEIWKHTPWSKRSGDNQ